MPKHRHHALRYGNKGIQDNLFAAVDIADVAVLSNHFCLAITFRKHSVMVKFMVIGGTNVM